jgi:hypothetical protein
VIFDQVFNSLFVTSFPFVKTGCPFGSLAPLVSLSRNNSVGRKVIAQQVFAQDEE